MPSAEWVGAFFGAVVGFVVMASSTDMVLGWIARAAKEAQG